MTESKYSIWIERCRDCACDCKDRPLHSYIHFSGLCFNPAVSCRLSLPSRNAFANPKNAQPTRLPSQAFANVQNPSKTLTRVKVEFPSHLNSFISKKNAAHVLFWWIHNIAGWKLKTSSIDSHFCLNLRGDLSFKVSHPG